MSNFEWDFGQLLIRSIDEPEKLELIASELQDQPWQFDLSRLTEAEREWLAVALGASIEETFLRIQSRLKPKKAFTWAECGPSLLFPIPKRGSPGESASLVFSFAWPAYVHAMELLGIRVQLYCHPAKEGEKNVDGNVIHLYLRFPDGQLIPANPAG